MDSHYNNETVPRLSYHYDGNPCTWKDGLYIERGPWFSSLPARPVSDHFHMEASSYLHSMPRRWRDCICIHRPASEKGRGIGEIELSDIKTQPNSWRNHEMETLFALLALCEGNPLVTSGLPSQRASNNFLVGSLNNTCWTNSPVARDYRSHDNNWYTQWHFT